jgi:hypothetical protein
MKMRLVLSERSALAYGTNGKAGLASGPNVVRIKAEAQELTADRDNAMKIKPGFMAR